MATTPHHHSVPIPPGPAPTATRIVAQPDKPDDAADLHELLSRTQALMNDLEALSHSAAPPAALEPEATAGSEPKTIGELDQALSAKLDAILQADSGAIESVLDSVFEQKATIVQNLGDPSPEPLPAPSVAVAQQIPETTNLQRETSEEARQFTSQISHLEEQRVVELPAILSALPRAKNNIAQQRAHSAWIGALKLIVVLLTIANCPLRYVPRRLRPVFDWTVVTLILWAPIVWIMVFTIRHKSPAKTVDAHEAAPQSQRVRAK